MRHYQQLLMAALGQNGWQLDERRSSEQWWLAELWVISSVRERHGFQLFCAFIIDPQAERPSDIAAVRSIAFTSEPLCGWPQADSAPVVLRPAERNFPAEIASAMLRLDELRSNGHRLTGA